MSVGDSHSGSVCMAGIMFPCGSVRVLVDAVRCFFVEEIEREGEKEYP